MRGRHQNTKLHKILSTIRVRILLITVSLIVVISVIITLISYYLVSNNLRQNLIQTHETMLSFLCSSIDSNLGSVTEYVHACQNSDKIQNFALETDASDNRIKREAHDFVTETYASNALLPSRLIRLVIIGKNRSDIVQLTEASYSTVHVSSDAIVSLPYFEELHEHPGESSEGILYDPFFTTKQVPMLPFVYPIYHPYKADETGYIFMEMSVNTITAPIHNYSTETSNRFYFKIGSHLYQYHNNTLDPCEDTLEVISDLHNITLNQNTRLQKIYDRETSETFLMISQPLAIGGWYAMACIDENELSQDIMRTFSLIFLIIIAVASLIGFLLFGFLSQTVNVPVKKLQQRMKRIEEGDFSRDSSTEWEHELGDIGKTINDLSENVLLLMNQRIEDEKQKKDYEYRMLQSQINPHFLYNTLNSIKWMATIQNAPGIAEMTTALSRLLKNISKGTASLIPLRQELDLIQDYFTIQQYRYGGTITLTVSTDDETLLSCMIVKFTLQPLIENAIFHGIEPKGTAGNIVIHIFRDSDDDVRIDVRDDGVGMEQELASVLTERDCSASDSFFKEIGISNVHKRIQYEFGSKYGLTITSAPGEGTTITILLPFTKSEEKND